MHNAFRKSHLNTLYICDTKLTYILPDMQVICVAASMQRRRSERCKFVMAIRAASQLQKFEASGCRDRTVKLIMFWVRCF
jgi:hypothetical protein